jgi:hypothetical protein
MISGKCNNRTLNFSLILYHVYSPNVIDVDWGLVVKLALPAKLTRRAYYVFGVYDIFFINVVQS